MKKFIIVNALIYIFLMQLKAQSYDKDLGLQAFYPFTGNAIDYSGNGHDGIVFGEALLTTDRFGNQNCAYEFDGIDDYINTFSTFDFEERTLSVWINPYDTIGSGGSGDDTMINVAISQDDIELNYGILRVDIDDGNMKLWAGGVSGTYTDSTIIPHNWYHLVLVRNENSTKYYVNGEFVGSGTSDNIGSSYLPNYNFIVGCGRTTDNQYFNGKIDDIRIYNRALQQCEIESLFNNNEPDLDLGLQVFYPFSGNADDYSDYGHNAEIFGGALLTTDRFGNSNKAFEFDGVDDYMNTYSSFDFENRSLSAWINPYELVGSGGSGNNTLMHVAMTQDDYLLQYGVLRIDIDDGQMKLWAGGATGTYTRAPVFVDTWYHIVLVRDSNFTKYYINGELVGNGSSDSIASSYNPNSDFVIGCGRSLQNQFFKGKIDDIRIYNRTLTECEIALLFSESVAVSNNENDESEIIQIYPNPFSSDIKILYNNNIEICIFDYTGRLILSRKYFGQNSIIDLSEFSDGVYILKSSNDDHATTKKLLKIH
jgi:hypothetical protein